MNRKELIQNNFHSIETKLYANKFTNYVHYKTDTGFETAIIDNNTINGLVTKAIKDGNFIVEPPKDGRYREKIKLTN